jgi:hypothetical protein
MTSSLKTSGPQAHDQQDLEQKFRFLALRYAEIGAHKGIRIIPFQSPDTPLMLAASQEEKQRAIHFLQTIVDIHEETISSGHCALNSQQLIWRALSKFSLIPSGDIFEHINDEDPVAIYGADQTALFWNLQFFRYISFTVEQMFFSRWFEATHRDPVIQQDLYQMATDIIAGIYSGTFRPKVPAHEVQELNTIDCLRTWMEFPVASILTSNGAFGGMMMIQRMKILSTAQRSS